MHKLIRFLETPSVRYGIDGLLIINAVILGMLSFPFFQSGDVGVLLQGADQCIVVIFVVEILLRILAYGKSFFKDGWNIFDFIVVFGSCLAYDTTISMLRTLRVLRILRVISTGRGMRRIIDVSIHCVGDVLSIIGLSLVLVFIYAVMACGFFGKEFPDQFGNLFASAYALMKLALFVDWDNVAAVVGADRDAPIFLFFFSYFVLISFVMLNMMIAVIYDAYEIAKEMKIPPEEESRQDLDMRLSMLEKKVDRLLEITQINCSKNVTKNQKDVDICGKNF